MPAAVAAGVAVDVRPELVAYTYLVLALLVGAAYVSRAQTLRAASSIVGGAIFSLFVTVVPISMGWRQFVPLEHSTQALWLLYTIGMLLRCDPCAGRLAHRAAVRVARAGRLCDRHEYRRPHPRAAVPLSGTPHGCRARRGAVDCEHPVVDVCAPPVALDHAPDGRPRCRRSARAPSMDQPVAMTPSALTACAKASAVRRSFSEGGRPGPTYVCDTGVADESL